MRHPLAFPCLLIASLPLAAQQGSESYRGPFAATSHVYCQPVDVATSPLRLKWEGDSPSWGTIPWGPPPPPPTGDIQADFRPSALFPGFESFLELDAISSGNDMLPVDSARRLQPAGMPFGWASIQFSVSATTTDTPGSIVNQRSQTSTGPGADIYGYFAPGSINIPSILVGAVVLEQGADHIGIGGSNAEVSAHDLMIPQLQIGARPGNLGGMIQKIDSFYFSVTPACAAVLEAERASHPLLGPWLSQIQAPIHAGSVYYMQWTDPPGSTPPGWTQPVEAWSAAALGILDDLDALAVDPVSSGLPGYAFPPCVLYSEAGSRDLIVLVGTGTPGPLLDRNGNPLQLIDVGDVDALCTTDPEKSTFNRNIGLPIVDAAIDPKFGLSVVGDGLNYTFVMSGWPDQIVTPGALDLYLDINNTGYQLLEHIPRAIKDHSVQRTYTLPAPMDADVTAVATFRPTNNPSEVSYTWVIRLRLTVGPN